MDDDREKYLKELDELEDDFVEEQGRLGGGQDRKQVYQVRFIVSINLECERVIALWRWVSRTNRQSTTTTTSSFSTHANYHVYYQLHTLGVFLIDVVPSISLNIHPSPVSAFPCRRYASKGRS